MSNGANAERTRQRWCVTVLTCVGTVRIFRVVVLVLGCSSAVVDDSFSATPRGERGKALQALPSTATSLFIVGKDQHRVFLRRGTAAYHRPASPSSSPPTPVSKPASSVNDMLRSDCRASFA